MKIRENGLTENKIPLKKSKNKLFEILIIFGICVLVLVFFFADFNIFSDEKTNTHLGTFEEYVLNLENKIAKTISNIDGVGNASVTISFETGVEKCYAYESVVETSTGEIVEELLLYKGEPVVLKENMPKVLGVVVVAKGASNAVVRLNVVRTIQVLLGVTYDKIEVFTFRT